MKVRFSGHALTRMFEREISTEDVLHVLEQGEVIADYPEDQPFPSCLLLGWRKGKPLHVVAAKAPDDACVVVTVYVPSEQIWNEDFKTRREP